MECHVHLLSNTCGVTLHHGFGQSYAWDDPELGGAKLACAGFVNTTACEKAYKELAKKFNIVYQSSVRKNRNSGRQFFFVVYDGRKAKE